MGSMLIALGLYIVGIVIMGAVVFYVGKQVLEILSQPVAKIIVGAICAFIVFGTIKELQVGFSWSNSWYSDYFKEFKKMILWWKIPR